MQATPAVQPPYRQADDGRTDSGLEATEEITMQHTTAAAHGSRERIGPRPFVRMPVPDLDVLPGVPRRLPPRLRRRPTVTVPPN